MKLYFIAGERSGDLHAGNLIKALRKHNPELQCRGFGGDYMQQAGMDVVVHYRELAFMGFAEVIANLHTIRKKLAFCKEDILQFKPDAVVLVDYAGFNMRIAKFLKANSIKVFWYIAPKVWAWNQNRAKTLKANVDSMFCILPFEKAFFKKFDWDVDYVGNPVLDAVKAHTPNSTLIDRNEKFSVALLPGSRKQELKRIIPLMAGVVKQIPEAKFFVAAVDSLDSELYGELKNIANVQFVYNQTYDLLQQVDAAIVTSGTATLETALFKVPQVVVYKTSSLSYWIGRKVIRVPFISLVNLIPNRAVVTELIQDDASIDRTSAELKSLLTNPQRIAAVKAGYEEIITMLDTGSASENTAQLILKYLNLK